MIACLIGTSLLAICVIDKSLRDAWACLHVRVGVSSNSCVNQNKCMAWQRHKRREEGTYFAGNTCSAAWIGRQCLIMTVRLMRIDAAFRRSLAERASERPSDE